jgi:hypothetical protein
MLSGIIRLSEAVSLLAHPALAEIGPLSICIHVGRSDASGLSLDLVLDIVGECEAISAGGQALVEVRLGDGSEVKDVLVGDSEAIPIGHISEGVEFAHGGGQTVLGAGGALEVLAIRPIQVTILFEWSALSNVPRILIT